MKVHDCRVIICFKCGPRVVHSWNLLKLCSLSVISTVVFSVGTDEWMWKKRRMVKKLAKTLRLEKRAKNNEDAKSVFFLFWRGKSKSGKKSFFRLLFIICFIFSARVLLPTGYMSFPDLEWQNFGRKKSDDCPYWSCKSPLKFKEVDDGFWRFFQRRLHFYNLKQC